MNEHTYKKSVYGKEQKVYLEKGQTITEGALMVEQKKNKGKFIMDQGTI